MKRPLIIALFILALLVASCTQANPGDAPEPAPTIEMDDTAEQESSSPNVPEIAQDISELMIVRGSDIVSLHPNMSTDPDSQNVMRSMYESLVYLDENQNYSPELATSWEVVDARTYRFHLREGVVFHNGEPFTADDVLYTFNQLNNPSEDTPDFVVSRYSSIVESVEKEDDYTVVFTLNEEFPIVLYNFYRVNIVPDGVPLEELSENPIGTGAYMFEEWANGDHVTLVANPQYWGGEPDVKQVTFRTVPEPSARYAEVETGRADIAFKIPYQFLDSLQQLNDYQTEQFSDAYIMHLDINTYKPLMENVLVRQAIAYSVDKEVIVNSVLGGFGKVANGPLQEWSFGYDPSYEDYPYDPAKAQELLVEAGYPDGINITIAYPSGRYAFAKEVSEAVAAQLAEGGITAELRAYEWSVHLQNLQEKTTDELFFIGWSNAPADFYQPFYHTPSNAPYSLAQSEALDRLINEYASTVNEQERTDLASQALQAFKDYVPSIPLYEQSQILTYRSSLGLTVGPDEIFAVKNITLDQ